MQTEKDAIVSTDFHNSDDEAPFFGDSYKLVVLIRPWNHPHFEYKIGECKPVSEWAEILHISSSEFVANLIKKKYVKWFKLREEISAKL